MIFYFLFLVFISCLLLLEYFFPKKQKILVQITLCIIILIAGFRYRIGSDYDSYVSWYLHKTRDHDFEFGFVIIMNLFRLLNLSPLFLFFFFSFFTCYFVYLAIKKYTINSNVALLFYLLIPSLYLTSFSLVRQSFSVAISFYSFYYLINKKYIIYVLLMFIGISIHITCLIPFGIFLLVYKWGNKINIKYLLGFIIGSFFLGQFNLLQIFSGLFGNSRYLDYFSNKAVPVNVVKVIIMNLEGILILFYFQKLKDKYEYQKYLSVLYYFSIVFVNLFSKNNDLIRVSTYFRIFEILVLADLFFLETNRRRIFLFSCFYVLYFTAFLVGLKKEFEIKNKNIPKFIPYKNILWMTQNKLNI